MTSPSPTIPITTMPEVGQPVTLPIVSAPLRTTLFPEAAPLVSIGTDAIEVILLRNEVVFTAQNGTVVDADDGVGVEMTLAPPMVQMLDLGHVRLPVKLASELGVSLLQHVCRHHGANMGDLIARLQPERDHPYVDHAAN